MTEIIFCGMPKRASTVQRRVRSTESYALVSSIKRTAHTTEFVFSAPTPCAIDSYRIGGRTVWLETALFLRQDPHVNAIVTEAACATSEIPL